MAEKSNDIWARWVLERQFGNDPERQKAGLASGWAVAPPIRIPDHRRAQRKPPQPDPSAARR
jgi:hypothetical protein